METKKFKLGMIDARIQSDVAFKAATEFLVAQNSQREWVIGNNEAFAKEVMDLAKALYAKHLKWLEELFNESNLN